MLNGSKKNRLLDDFRIVIAHHTIFTWGPDSMLAKYLKDSTELLYIHHPFDYMMNKRRSYFEIFKQGKKIFEQEKGRTHSKPTFSFLKDFLLNFAIILQQHHRYDLFIGVDPLNAFSGLIMRHLGLVNNVIFYPIDYTVKRFNNRLLNWIYHKIEIYSAKNADSTWILGKAALEIMVSQGADRNRCQYTPVAIDKIYYDSKEDRLSNPIVAYIGTLYPEKGVDLIITAMSSVIKTIPGTRLRIIGGGPIENELRILAEKCHIEASTEFTGFIPSHEEAMEKLSECTIGIVSYVPNTGLYTDTGFGGKVAEYLACGLPIIITKVAESWKEVERRRVGLPIEYDVGELANAITHLLGDRDLYEKYRNAAFESANDFYYETIFDRAFASMDLERKKQVPTP